MMRIMAAIGVVAVLVLGVAPATAAIWSQDMEGAFSPAGGNRDDRNESSTDEAPWDSSTNDLTTGMMADGFYASQPGWNGGTWAMSQSSYASQGSSSMKMAPNSGDLRDIWLGIKISGLTPGQAYTIRFDMAMDKSQLVAAGGNPGAQQGDDYVTSVSYNLRNTVENTLETISGVGLMTPAGFADCEDYPGHARNSVWLGNPALWDGNFHTITDTFTPDGTYFGGDVALVIKIRSHQAPNPGAGFFLDNIVVTPEPASLALLGLGGLALVRRRRR